MNTTKKFHTVDTLKSVLKKNGVKMTPQRFAVFMELNESKNHPDAEMIMKGVRKSNPGISLDTVYRTLWLFRDIGLIESLGSHREKTRFDANLDAHHHFICRKCGGIQDFHSEELDRIKIPEAVNSLGSVERTQVEVRGLCRKCRKEMDKANNR